MPMAVQRRTAYKLFDNGVVLPEGGWETPFFVFAFCISAAGVWDQNVQVFCARLIERRN